MRVGRFGFSFVFWMFVGWYVGVFVAILIQRNQVNVAVPDAPQGNQCLRKSMNRRGWPAQYNGFQAMVGPGACAGW